MDQSGPNYIKGFGKNGFNKVNASHYTVVSRDFQLLDHLVFPLLRNLNDSIQIVTAYINEMLTI